MLGRRSTTSGKKSFFLALTELNICDKTNLYNNHSRAEGQAGPQSVSWLVMKTKHAQAEEILIIIVNIVISYLGPGDSQQIYF